MATKRKSHAGPVTPGTLQILAVVMTDAHSPKLSFYKKAESPTAANVQASLILRGIPRIQRRATGAFPTAASIVANGTGNFLQLTYGGNNLAHDDIMDILPDDTGIRDNAGANMLPGSFLIP